VFYKTKECHYRGEITQWLKAFYGSRNIISYLLFPSSAVPLIVLVHVHVKPVAVRYEHLQYLIQLDSS